MDVFFLPYSVRLHEKKIRPVAKILGKVENLIKKDTERSRTLSLPRIQSSGPQPLGHDYYVVIYVNDFYKIIHNHNCDIAFGIMMGSISMKDRNRNIAKRWV